MPTKTIDTAENIEDLCSLIAEKDKDFMRVLSDGFDVITHTMIEGMPFYLRKYKTNEACSCISIKTYFQMINTRVSVGDRNSFPDYMSTGETVLDINALTVEMKQNTELFEQLKKIRTLIKKALTEGKSQHVRQFIEQTEFDTDYKIDENQEESILVYAIRKALETKSISPLLGLLPALGEFECFTRKFDAALQSILTAAKALEASEIKHLLFDDTFTHQMKTKSSNIPPAIDLLKLTAGRQLIRELVRKDPHAIGEQELNTAIMLNPNQELTLLMELTAMPEGRALLRELVEINPHAITAQGLNQPSSTDPDKGRTPLMILSATVSGLAVLKKLVEKNPHAITAQGLNQTISQGSHEGFTPLILLSMTVSGRAVLKKLIEKNPHAMTAQGLNHSMSRSQAKGLTPLMILSPTESGQAVLKELVEKNPHAITAQGLNTVTSTGFHKGETPLFILSTKQSGIAILSILLEKNPKAITLPGLQTKTKGDRYKGMTPCNKLLRLPIGRQLLVKIIKANKLNPLEEKRQPCNGNIPQSVTAQATGQRLTDLESKAWVAQWDSEVNKSELRVALYGPEENRAERMLESKCPCPTNKKHPRTNLFKRKREVDDTQQKSLPEASHQDKKLRLGSNQHEISVK